MLATAARVTALLAAVPILVWARGLAGPGPLLLDGTFQYAATLSLALVVAGFGLGTAWARASGWAAVGLVGHATALRLVEAGPAVRYSHWWFAAGADTDVTRVAILGLYAALVLLGVAPYAGRIARWIREELGVVRAGLLLAAFVVLSASPMRDVRLFALEMVVASAFGLVSLLNVVLIGLATPAGALGAIRTRFERWFPADRRILGLDKVAVLAAVFVLLFSTALAVWVWERHAHISDEITFSFLAKYVSAGMLSAPGAPVPDAFNAYQVDCTLERCISVSQPGWPFVLSLGYRAGAPWLVNPVLGALNVVLLSVLLRSWYGVRAGRLGALLLAFSPWHLFLAMSFMNHQTTLAAGLVAAIGTTYAIQRASVRWALLAGLGTGVTSVVRPLDGVFVGAACGLPLLLAGTWGRRLTSAALFGAVAAGVGSLTLVYNRAVTGDPFDFPVTSYFNRLYGEGANDLGFGPDRGIHPAWAHMDPLPGHTPLEAGLNAFVNTTAIEFEMFGWALGSLVPLLLLLGLGRLRRLDLAMVGTLGLLVLCYSLYWFASGPDFVARYWFLGIVPFIALTVRGFEEIAARIPALAGGPAPWKLATVLTFLFASSLLVMVPWRSGDKYYRYVGSGPGARELVASGQHEGDIFLISGKNQPDYAGTLLYNPLDLRSRAPLFAFDSVPGVVAKLREAYPDRRILRLEGPSITGAGYRLVGPLADTFDVARPEERTTAAVAAGEGSERQ